MQHDPSTSHPPVDPPSAPGGRLDPPEPLQRRNAPPRSGSQPGPDEAGSGVAGAGVAGAGVAGSVVAGPGDLEQLEADIAAVGSALETVERIVGDAESGAGSMRAAAGEVAGVVSPERFGHP